jgi:hypothetical protein
VNGFIDHLYTPLGTTSNHSAAANLHNSQITTAKSSPACSVFNGRFLVTGVNSGDSSASRAQVLPSRFQYRTDCQLSTELVAPILFFITPRRGPRRQHPVSPVACVTVATGTCLPIRSLETGCITPLFIRLLHSNGCRCYNIILPLVFQVVILQVVFPRSFCLCFPYSAT